MSKSMVISGGLVLTPGGPVEADVLVADGAVSEIGSNLQGDTIHDASGCWVGPAFVDLHVHLREPGQEWKEDVASGSAAAAAGGFGAVVAMANTTPAIDSGYLAEHIARKGVEVGLCDVFVAGAISLGRKGIELAHLDDLWDAGVRIFSDDGDSVADAGLLRRAMEYLQGRGGIVAQHAEDTGLAAGGHMHEGDVSSQLGIAGLPSIAEEVVVARDLQLVELTGCSYHVQHVSTAGSVSLVAAAKASGLPVTAEVCPHHLALDHTLVLGMSGSAKMYPPLRAASDVTALIDALKDGTIDCVATDHAPHSANEKEVPFEEAPRGVIGLETAGSVVNSAVDLPPMDFFDRMSVAPAHILGAKDHGQWLAEGTPANLVVFDPSREWKVPRHGASKSSNTPWADKVLTGRVELTVLRGNVTFQRSTA
jgi:dihydroorotase